MRFEGTLLRQLLRKRGQTVRQGVPVGQNDGDSGFANGGQVFPLGGEGMSPQVRAPAIHRQDQVPLFRFAEHDRSLLPFEPFHFTAQFFVLHLPLRKFFLEFLTTMAAFRIQTVLQFGKRFLGSVSRLSSGKDVPNHEEHKEESGHEKQHRR